MLTKVHAHSTHKFGERKGQRTDIDTKMSSITFSSTHTQYRKLMIANRKINRPNYQNTERQEHNV